MQLQKSAKTGDKINPFVMGKKKFPKAPFLYPLMSDESCFTTDTVVWREIIQIFCKFPTSWNSQVIGKHKHFLFWFCFYKHFNMQFTYAVFYIQNRKVYLSKKILYQDFVVFALLGTVSFLKSFHMWLNMWLKS